MAEETPEEMYSFLAQAYIRLQAEEVLGHCLKEGKLAPLQTLVEKLVVAGPVSLDALREFLAEVESQQDEIHRGFSSTAPDRRRDQDPATRDLHLLGEIDLYLQDWFWSLVYLSAHQENRDAPAFPSKAKYLN